MTLKVAISGQGNFEGMNAPLLTEDEGWRSYPPSDKLQSTDSVGFTGEKTFEFPLIARQDQTRTPGVRFSYFDPGTSKYVVLTQDPLEVDAKAGGAPPAAPASTPAPQESKSALPAAPSPTPDVTAMAGGSSSWMSLLFRREFFIANAALAVAWLAIFFISMLRRFSQSRAGREIARKKRLREALAGLQEVDPGGFYEKARDYLILRLCDGGDDLAVTAKLERLPLPPGSKAPLLQVLERHGQLKYAAGGTALPSVDERQVVIAILKDLDKAHEK